MAELFCLTRVAQPLGLSSQGELINTYKGASTYDAAGRRKLEGAVPNNALFTGMSFDYNHKNERTFRYGSNRDRQFAYDEASHLIAKYTGNGALIVEYVWLGDRPIAAIYPNNRIVYLVADHQNKPRRGIDAATQQIVWSWDADAFGVLPPNASATNGITINLRFPGQYYDVHSGLYYNHNRYYNPELGRYMEVDPIGLEAGLNPYVYVGSNPVSRVDPSGLFSVGDMLDDSAMRAASMDNTFELAALSFASAAWNILGAENISKWADGQSSSKIGVGFEAVAAMPVVGTLGKLGGVAKSAVAKGGTDFFRGAKGGLEPSFIPRPNDFKVDPVTGFVKDTHGVSIFDNAESILSKGFVPHKVDQNTIPDALRIIQRGSDPKHYEIVPKLGANLTPEQFIRACSAIKCL